MSKEDIWNRWVEPYDVFVSYSRDDNKKPHEMVSAVVDLLKADFKSESSLAPLNPFFDKEVIDDMRRWMDEIRVGIWQSKVMIAFLSEAYFDSECCRLEWEEYISVERCRTYPGEALSPIFTVSHADLEKKISLSARQWWQNVTARNAIVELHPYWPNGRKALEDEIIRKRFERLKKNIRERTDHGRLLEAVPRDIRGGRTPFFVGREQQLQAVLARMMQPDMPGICALNGVGGIGKTSIAREYAYQNRTRYLGGQFSLNLSQVNSIEGLLGLLVEIANSKLNAGIPLDAENRYRLARTAFEKLQPGVRSLLILDNLNEDATHLVGQTARSELPNAEKVHLLITTRAQERALGGIRAIPVDVLTAEEALDLLLGYRQFDRTQDEAGYLAARQGNYELTELSNDPADAEWNAALAIVNRLGRHALAVTLVGAYLGNFQSISYRAYARALEEHGIGIALEHAGNEINVQNMIQHPKKLIADLFEYSLKLLSPLELRTLEYAAHLPPDLIPVNWLEKLIRDDPEMQSHLKSAARFGSEDAWPETLETLRGLRYLTRSQYAVMHRVLQEVIRSRLKLNDAGGAIERERLVLSLVRDLAASNSDDVRKYGDENEFKAVEQVVRLNAKSEDLLIGKTALCIVRHLQNRGSLAAAAEHAMIARDILKGAADADAESVDKQQDLAISCNQLGDVAISQGNLAAAAGQYENGLKISLKLSLDDPNNSNKKRNLSISYERLGNVALHQHQTEIAAKYYLKSFDIRKEAVAEDPSDRMRQRDLSNALGKMSRAAKLREKYDSAAVFRRESLPINVALVKEGASDAEWRDLSVCYLDLGDIEMLRNKIGEAVGHYIEGRDIVRDRAKKDPADPAIQSDLSVFNERLGDVEVRCGNLGAAKKYYDDVLKISLKLASEDQSNADKQRDLSICYNKLGEVEERQNKLERAKDYYTDSLKIGEKLAAKDPINADKQRDLSITYFHLACVAAKQPRILESKTAAQAGIGVLEKLQRDGVELFSLDLERLEALRQVVRIIEGGS